MLLERERLHERERIARVVHDGVLQSLAYIHRRGDEIGGEARDLRPSPPSRSAYCAGSSGTGAPDVSPTPDLRGGEGSEPDPRLLLTARESPDVSVSVPADLVLTDARWRGRSTPPPPTLDNVVRHAGAGARARVLLEGDSAASR